ncbi:MAG: DUF814 domain-containing protein [Gemmatimonas sp.]|nr:DUF814 domain-containing protein [Gemmatimonas sp.]
MFHPAIADAGHQPLSCPPRVPIVVIRGFTCLSSPCPLFVIPRRRGSSGTVDGPRRWIPAFERMTLGEIRNDERREMAEGGGYRTFIFDGHEILVGKNARDNDRLTFRVATPGDLWLHASGYSGSHVIVRQPATEEVPRAVVEVAAQLAAFHSKARGVRGKVEVHVCRAGDVRKPPGAPAGQVRIRRGEAMRVYARNPFPEVADDE